MQIDELNKYAQLVVARIEADCGTFTLTPFRASQLSIDLTAVLTLRKPSGEDINAQVRLRGLTTGQGDRDAVIEVDRQIYAAYTALRDQANGEDSVPVKKARWPKIFNLFTLRITVERDRRMKSLWQWLTRQKCPNEMYAPDAEGFAACASPEQRARRRRLMDPQAYAAARAAMPDYSGLSDEELAERQKTAKLGEGIIAEVGLRALRKGDISL